MEPRSAGRSLKIEGKEVARTPLVLASFSSKVWGRSRDRAILSETVAQIGKIIVSPILVSAYDLHLELLSDAHGRLALSAPLTFIDSGGYEANRILQEATDCGCDPVGAGSGTYGQEEHRRALALWPRDRPAVVVNYDTYSEHLEQQVEAAASLCPGLGVGRLLLLKPRREHEGLRGTIEQIGPDASALWGIDAVGLTEKEAGSSLRQRLRTIATLRAKLDCCGLENMPIHVFGGLDPVRSPLYFLAGADIFDGLSWLRYGYEGGQAVYLDAYASIAHPDVPIDEAVWLVRRANYLETTRMQTNMLGFLATGDANRLHGRVGEMLSLLADTEGPN